LRLFNKLNGRSGLRGIVALGSCAAAAAAKKGGGCKDEKFSAWDSRAGV